MTPSSTPHPPESQINMSLAASDTKRRSLDRFHSLLSTLGMSVCGSQCFSVSALAATSKRSQSSSCRTGLKPSHGSRGLDSKLMDGRPVLIMRLE